MLLEQDDQILAFNKPSGLPCQTRKPDDRTLDKLLWAFAKSNGKRPRLVHRIDGETSGVVIAARTQPAAAALSGSFENRAMRKTYLAIVEGDARRLSRVDSPVGTFRRTDGAIIAGIGGKPGVKDTKEAITRFHCVLAGDQVSLIECRPETGRMHQIRIHLAHAGHPILGDEMYGATKTAPRVMLHAARLEGPHPLGGVFDYSAPYPEDFEAMIGQLDG